MTIGTKSILFGSHCLLLHPLFVATAWWRSYGFPFDPRLWVSFFVHDLGYFGCCDIDGSDGENHVLLGARIMGRLFGLKWEEFTRCHSRYWARRSGRRFSRLCVADKLAFVITPAWLYLPMAKWTGELDEYRQRLSDRAGELPQLEPWEKCCLRSQDEVAFLAGLRSYTKRWVDEHRGLAEDHWTIPRERLSIGDPCADAERRTA